MTTTNDALLFPPAAVVHFTDRKGNTLPAVLFCKEAAVLEVLVVVASTVATLALLVMMAMTAFVVRLGFIARRTPDPHKRALDA